MGQWAVIVPADRWATERLFEHETLAVTVPGAQPGDEVLLVAGAEPQAHLVGRQGTQRRLDDAEPPVEIVAPTELVIRRSTGRARRGLLEPA